ncbi:MAG: outer membrane protein assembly factor BamB [Rhodocyclales bacterium]|nr:outer membrane protein assembly factor BamB [Rhodocyclales bacterium]
MKRISLIHGGAVLRSLRTAALFVCVGTMLNACFLWSEAPGPKPSPLPNLSGTVKLHSDWQKSMGALTPTVLRPAVVGISVFAASADGTLARFENGREIWSIRAAKALSGGVAANGKLVVVAGAGGELLAFDSLQGKPLWHTQLSGEVSGLPLIADDIVVVRVGDNLVLAFNTADGKQRWIYQRTQSSLTLRAYAGFGRVGDTVLAGFSGGKLVSLSQGGGFPRWEATVALPRGSNELERMTDLVGEPVVRGDTVCVAAYQARVACVDATQGSVRWTRDIGSSVGADADDKTLYVTDTSGAVHALDIASGATLWKQDKLAWRGVGRPLVIGDYVAVADTLGYVHLLDRKEGRFMGRLDVDSSGIAAPMALLGKGFILQARDGTVHLISLAETSK